MAVTLADALKEGPKPSTSDYELLFIDGVVGPDTQDGFIRIYSDAARKHQYLVVRKEDVIESELQQWTDSELAHAGFVGQTRYRIPVKYGAVAHAVSVSSVRLGQASPSKGGSSGGQPGYSNTCFCQRDSSGACKYSFQDCFDGWYPSCSSQPGGGCGCSCQIGK